MDEYEKTRYDGVGTRRNRGTTEVSAQSWLDQLGKKVKEKTKDKVEQKILQKPSRRKREGRKYWPVRDTMFLRKKFLMATLFQG